MEALPDNKLLKFNPDTLIALRRMYNLDKPGQMDEAIDILDAWVKKESHFVKKDYSREYLERVIILLKGSVERAKGQLDKICTLRSLLPHFFEKCDAKYFYDKTNGFKYKAILPRLTPDHARIVVYKYENPTYTPETHMILHEYFFTVLICEYLKAHDYSTCLSGVVDMRGLNIMDIISLINLNEMKQACTIFLDGYAARVQNIFFLSSSKGIDVLVKIFKQMVSEKLGNRVHVLKEVEELHEHIPKDLLPSDYGGNEKSLAELHEQFKEELGSKDNVKYFKDMSQAKTIESLRVTSNYHQDFSGLSGTFRTLSVD